MVEMNLSEMEETTLIVSTFNFLLRGKREKTLNCDSININSFRASSHRVNLSPFAGDVENRRFKRHADVAHVFKSGGA
jgi:hypothetical protein